MYQKEKVPPKPTIAAVDQRPLLLDADSPSLNSDAVQVVVAPATGTPRSMHACPYWNDREASLIP